MNHVRRNLSKIQILVLVVVPLVFPEYLFGQFQVVGYYPSWLRWTLPASQVPFEYLTHLNHAFAWPKTDGSIGYDFSLNDPQLVQQAHMAGRKIILSVGGWGHSAAFPVIAADTTLRRTFLDNLIAFVQAQGYDGIDLDWEFPQNQTDKRNLTELFRELRARCDTANPPLLLTVAIGTGEYYGQWHEYEKLVELVDWFNVMTYDFHGSWTNHAGHNSPLYAPAQCSHGDIQSGLAYLSQIRRIPKTKMRLGIPFYGRMFYASGLYASSTGGDVTYNYAEIRKKIESGGWNYLWDSYSLVPYLTNSTGTQVITFDDSLSVAHKVKYAYDNGLGGVMIWALGQDWLDGRAVLLEAIHTEMERLTTVSPGDQIPESVSLAVYPNPVKKWTVIEFSLPETTEVTVLVYNSIGQVVKSAKSQCAFGLYQIRWEPGNLPNGVYFVKLLTPRQIHVKKVLLFR